MDSWLSDLLAAVAPDASDELKQRVLADLQNAGSPMSLAAHAFEQWARKHSLGCTDELLWKSSPAVPAEQSGPKVVYRRMAAMTESEERNSKNAVRLLIAAGSGEVSAEDAKLLLDQLEKETSNLTLTLREFEHRIRGKAGGP